jgi:hypothetical protein
MRTKAAPCARQRPGAAPDVYRVATYIVISKPKRMSSKDGLHHFMLETPAVELKALVRPSLHAPGKGYYPSWARLRIHGMRVSALMKIIKFHATVRDRQHGRAREPTPHGGTP